MWGRRKVYRDNRVGSRKTTLGRPGHRRKVARETDMAQHVWWARLEKGILFFLNECKNYQFLKTCASIIR